ncbi:DUF503 domain-containing protein [Neobacillus thermocopriae]|uniref:DUF503 family protein n=1 Tax=Neobacillus thermocopriae TaxID=1215031 RepID=A0A6B3TL91_9BACI|nr:DUF503 family protein [Neobacillus thermocopriae]MED3624221.1 DUF503 family protein [Neobacillus thermocopriae]MED3713584.1 DUF503 family protein [Neobacillus thermocopriae]NEX77694.1 DUF503 family protein [Neobacillus thermocopriae]
MIIGSAEVECIIYNAHSLKEKRAVLQRILSRLKQKYNVAVAEVDYQDIWQRTKIAIVSVTQSKTSTEQELQKALKMIDSFPEIERTITEIEWL